MTRLRLASALSLCISCVVVALDTASAQVSTVPVSRNDSLTLPFNTTGGLATPGVLTNDTAPAATVTVITPPTGGTVNLAPTGGLTFTPTPGFVGATSFTYRATNESGTGNVATVTVTVLPAGTPEAVRDSYAIDQGATLTVPAPGVLGNDTNPLGGAFTARLAISRPEVTLNPDGGFAVQPDPGFSGTFNFFYVASNASGASNVQSVSIAVAPSPALAQAPSNLFAHSLVGNRLTLQWTPPVGGLVPTSYLLEGGVASGQALAQFATTDATPTLTLTVPNGAFYLRVRTVAGGQTSPPSSEIRIWVNQPIFPASPTRLLGLASGRRVELSWKNRVASGDLTSVILDVAGPISTSLPLGPVETFSFDGVPFGTYSFSLRAANLRGIDTLPSNYVLLTFPGSCSAPAAPPSFVASVSGRQLTLQWDAPSSGSAAMSYVLSASGSFNGSLPMAGRSFSAQVPPGTYSLAIRAANACGLGVPTAAQTVVVQ